MRPRTTTFKPSPYAPVKDIWVAPAGAGRVRVDIGGGGQGGAGTPDVFACSPPAGAPPGLAGREKLPARPWCPAADVAAPRRPCGRTVSGAGRVAELSDPDTPARLRLCTARGSLRGHRLKPPRPPSHAAPEGASPPDQRSHSLASSSQTCPRDCGFASAPSAASGDAVRPLSGPPPSARPHAPRILRPEDDAYSFSVMRGPTESPLVIPRHLRR